MTHTVHVQLLAAQKKTAYTPSLQTKIEDNDLPHPQTHQAYPLAGFSGHPTAAAVILTVDSLEMQRTGAIVRAHKTTAAGISIQRITDPDDPDQWTAWTQLQAGASFPAIFSTGDLLVCVYQDNDTKAVNWRRSADVGLTWSAEQTLFTPAINLNDRQAGFSGGSLRSGLAYAIGSHIYVCLYNPTTDTFSDAADYDAGNTVTSLGITWYDDDIFRLAYVVEDYADWTDSALLIQQLNFDGTTGTWATPAVYAGLQGGAGASPAYTYNHVSLHQVGANTWLSFFLSANPDAGALFADGDHILAFSDDGTYFTAGIKLHLPYIADRLTVCQHPSGLGPHYLVADTVALSSTAITTTTLTTEDIHNYHIRYDGPSATCTLTLDNRSGALDGLSTGRLGADLVLQRGAKVGLAHYRVELDTFIVDRIRRSKDGSQLVLHAYNYYRLLHLWHADLTYYYQNQALDNLVERIAALAGIHTFSTDGNAVWNTVVGSFAIQPGQSAAEAIAALQEQFQFVLRMAAGRAMYGLALSASPTSAYTFGAGAGEHPTVTVEDTADRSLPTITHAQVIGTGAAAESIAADLQSETGRQFTHRVERTFISSAADAATAAAAIINKIETSISRAAIVLMPAFHLQPFDPVDSDDWSSDTIRYVAGIEEVYNPLSRDTVARRRRPWYQTIRLATYTQAAAGGADVDLVAPEAMRLAAIKRGSLISFNTTTWKALVRIAGSVSAIELRVGEWVAPALLDAGSSVAVLLYDENNPDDGLVMGPYGGQGWSGLDRLYASDGDPVALQANSLGKLTTANALDVSTDLEVDGTLTVHGNADLDGDLDLEGNLTTGDLVSGTLAADSLTTPDIHAPEGEDLTIDADTNIDGDLDVSGTINAASITAPSTTISATGDLDISGDLSAAGTLSASASAITLGQDTAVNGDLDISGDVAIAGDLVLDGSGQAIKGAGSNTPDLGSATAAEQWGDIFLASGKNLFLAGQAIRNAATQTIYVATTGSDTTGDGSSGSPYASLQHVWDNVLPEIVNYHVTIQFQDGTYNLSADVTLYGKSGRGSVVIAGNSSDRNAVTIDGQSSYLPFVIRGVGVWFVRIQDMGINNGNANNFSIGYGARVTINNCVLRSATDHNIYLDSGAYLSVTGCNVKDAGGDGVRVSIGGILYATNNSSDVKNGEWGVNSKYCGIAAIAGTRIKGDNGDYSSSVGGITGVW